MQLHAVTCSYMQLYAVRRSNSQGDISAFPLQLAVAKGCGQAKLKKCYLLLMLLLELPEGLPALVLEEEVEGLLPPALA